MNPTDEQLKLIKSTGNLVAMSAYAGTGKTTTLVLYAKAHPHLRMTYIAFNRAVKEEAISKFPSNVKCVTGHGLAYGRYGVAYQDKLGNPRAFHLMKPLGIDSRVADLTLKAINNYLASADVDIEIPHVASLVGAKEQAGLIDCAKKAWQLMSKVGDKTVPMPHDGYLKLFQINGGKINADVILFDESQDASPLMLAIVANSNAKKIFVGDENQSIYSFRGAVNAMEDIKQIADEHLYLTASFRFGEGVADVANKILKEYRPLPKLLRGLGKSKTEFSVDVRKRHTKLSRTNAVLFDEAVRALQSGKSFGFVGPVDNYGFDALSDTFYLSNGQLDLVKDPVIKHFKSYSFMCGYAEAVDDKELKAKIKIVGDYGARIPDLVSKIKKSAKSNLSDVEITLTTAHKSKGLEWDSVYLTDDFTDMLEKPGEDGNPPSEPEREEINLLYVATTRALRCISLPSTISKWLDRVGYYQAIDPMRN